MFLYMHFFCSMGQYMYKIIIAHALHLQVGRWRHDDAEPFFDTKGVKVFPSRSSCGNVTKSVSNRSVISAREFVKGIKFGGEGGALKILLKMD